MANLVLSLGMLAYFIRDVVRFRFARIALYGLSGVC